MESTKSQCAFFLQPVDNESAPPPDGQQAASLITFLGHYRRDAGKCEQLCDEVLALPDSAIEPCLPQLCQALLQTIIWLNL